MKALRNGRGLVHACLTRDRERFPDCRSDPHALRLSVPARLASTLRFPSLAAGGYALALVHDENGNGQLDTFAGIPREGFGFSANPPIRFGPPSFGETRFTLAPGANRQTVRVKYLL